MRRSVSSIQKIIARTSIAAAFGIAVFGGAAYASDTVDQRHQQEMEQGKDHQLARDAASGTATPGDSQYLSARARKHLEAMNRGKDHYAAWDAIRVVVSGESARTHIEKMNKGKDHYADPTRPSR